MAAVLLALDYPPHLMPEIGPLNIEAACVLEVSEMYSQANPPQYRLLVHTWWLVEWKNGYRHSYAINYHCYYSLRWSINWRQSGKWFIYSGRKRSSLCELRHTAEALQPLVLGQKMSKCGRALVTRQPGEVKTSQLVLKSQYQARKSVTNYFKQLIFFFSLLEIR